MTVESLLRQAEALTPDERRELAARLMEAEPADDAPVTDSQLAEFRRRDAEMDADPSKRLPWEEVYAATMKRLGQ
ncbi:addiction module protein [Urbifossiella limnaea]|uniref:Addiction module component n=1 Tax=Urbifossiella limnaea TaxID=2528023 RepID=A0A517XYY7_9BACT|nr:addiction module protein [Urbifossiella limnaea]QDU22725.1 Putative addiction module component [Urbifossiella limnaea]